MDLKLRLADIVNSAKDEPRFLTGSASNRTSLTAKPEVAALRPVD